MARLSSIALAGVLACGAARAQDEAVARLQSLYAEERYGEALEQVAQLQDPVLAAEWRCYLELAGGDLPAALGAIRAGLALQPEHRGLLINGTQVALKLGLGEEALERVQLLSQTLERSPEPVAAEDRDRAERLVAAAQAQRALELQSASSLVLSRALGIAILASCVLALLALALRPIRRADSAAPVG